MLCLFTIVGLKNCALVLCESLEPSLIDMISLCGSVFQNVVIAVMDLLCACLIDKGENIMNVQSAVNIIVKTSVVIIAKLTKISSNHRFMKNNSA